MDAHARNFGHPRIAADGGVPSTSVQTLRLHDCSGLTLLPQRCLTLGSRYSSCNLCVRACPANALRVTGQGISVDQSCLGCGRCQAVCPNAALNIEGFDISARAASAAPTLSVVDCTRVPDAHRPDHGCAIPCLAGLSVGALLERCAALDPVPLVLLDRGWCARCPAGGGSSHPARAQVDQAAVLLAEAGVPQQQLPRIEARPLRQSLVRRNFIVAGGASSSRRGFLRKLAANALALADHTSMAAARQPVGYDLAMAPLPSVERERILVSLRRFAMRYGGALPRGLFHRVEIGSACAGHRICAATCPTAALRRYRDPRSGSSGVAFDSNLCIGCGRCAAICPQQAVTLTTGVGAPAVPGLQPLTGFETCICELCGDEFPTRAADANRLCDRCAKSRRLAQVGFAQLFGARQMSRAQ